MAPDARIASNHRDRATTVPPLDLLGSEANLTPGRWIAEPVVDIREREKQLQAAIEGFEGARSALASSVPHLNEAKDNGPFRWITVRDLVDSGVGTVISGVRPPADLKQNEEATRLVPLLTRNDVKEHDHARRRKVDVDQMTRKPPLTEPGDVILTVTAERSTRLSTRQVDVPSRSHFKLSVSVKTGSIPTSQQHS